MGLPRRIGLLAIGASTACSPNAAIPTDGPPREAGVQIGVSYDFEVSTHCGIEWARIDGAWWRTARLDDGEGNPPPGWDDPVQRGSLQIVTAERAEFEGGPTEPIAFVRTAAGVADDGSLAAFLSCD